MESALWEEQHFGDARGLRRFWRKLGAGGALENVRNGDRQAARLCDLVLVPTQDDRNRLAALMGDAREAARIRIVPNIAPAWALEGLSAARGCRETVRRLLFVGHLRYAPNVDAIDMLLHRIWPRVRSQFPDLRLVIAGRNPKRRIRRWIEAQEGVELIADPPSLGEVYDACDAVVVPLRLGGGSRLKVLEALAVGLPVIATAKAVEGLDLVEGRHWLRAETPEDCVAALRKLGRDQPLRERLIGEGRALIGERFTERALEQTLTPIISGLFEDPR
ncbi:glycosyltransferase family 4 protein [Nitratireductor sp. XY-223]|uniref:glycosyltransferase family 4 protein n=1 Tax=Nitratireductor sp. XY-223 TaxID=2561926 RepID=UPI0032B240CE